MKKKVLAGIMMAVMMMASVMGVSAAGSKTAEVYVSGASADYFVATATDDSLKSGATTAATNAGKQIITSTAVWNISEKTSGSASVNGNGKYDVQLTVSALTDSCSKVTVLVYNAGSQTWSAIEIDSSKVDYKNNTIAFELDSPSATIAICAAVAASGSTGTSPSTGVASSAWLICLAAAVVVVGVVSMKKSRS